MALPAPELDTYKFQDIVDDAKRRIGLRCPEWTDHNVSDPGVTLIELFAFMTEAMLYRMNQVPERNYIKFLELLGVSLDPPTPAQTDLSFRLSTPLVDMPDETGAGEIGDEITLPARRTIAATLRTETEEAIEFSLDQDLTLTRPNLVQVVAVPPERNNNPAAQTARAALPEGSRSWDFRPAELKTEPKPFAAFTSSPKPLENDTLYFGFDSDLRGNIVELLFECQTSAADQLTVMDPAQLWEVWDGNANQWTRAEILSDTTQGFDNSGSVIVALSMSVGARRLGEGPMRGTWLRARYTTDTKQLPLRPGQDPNKRPSVKSYNSPPILLGVSARTIGGTAPATNNQVIYGEELGESDATPGQIFSLRNAPLLPRLSHETLFIGPLDAPVDERVRWEEVLDFSGSHPDDRHFTCDSLTGEIRFGPNIASPDGSARQYGAIPPKGHTIVFGEYRIGGGVQGNLQENQLRIMKSNNTYIAEVSNPRRALGGREMETLDHAKIRAQALLRVRDRAVTREDFEYLARQASPAVGRARCVVPRSEVNTGVVRVLLIPELPRPSPNTPSPLGKQLTVPPHIKNTVTAYLDERRLLTTVLEIAEPEYVFVSTAISLVASPGFDPDTVRQNVRERLELFLHPLYGGNEGTGWPFERKLTLADLFAQVQSVPGVGSLVGMPRLFTSQLTDLKEGFPGPEEERQRWFEAGIPLEPHQIFCSREHRILVRGLNQIAELVGEESQNG